MCKTGDMCFKVFKLSDNKQKGEGTWIGLIWLGKVTGGGLL